MDLEQLLSLNQTARQEGQELSRYRPLLTRLLGYKARAFAGIIGARGTGKTVLLKQLATRWPDAFYISLDTAPRIDLFEVAEVLSASYGIKTLLLDEIHHYPGIHQELKKLYDFTSMRVVFTSSVALLMHETTHDLSRRVRLFPLSVLSFREFLMFSQNHDLPSVSFEDVVSAKLGPKYRLFDHLFTQYLCSGILPFSLHDPEPLELLRNIVTTVVQKDIPKVQDLKTSELDEVSNVIEFSAKSAADGVNPTSIGKNLGITKYKAAQYLDLLERAFIIKQIRAYGTNVLKEPKVLLMPPYRCLL